MNFSLNKKQWQIIASGIILLAAVTIVLPVLLGFVFTLGRLIMTIGIIVLVTLGISVTMVKYKRQQEINKNKDKIEDGN